MPTSKKDILKNKIDQLIVEMKEEKKLVSNEEYIRWLEKYLEKKTRIVSPQDGKLLSKEDKANINKLGLLFDAIAKYAMSNFIYPIEEEFTYYYYLKYHNKGYRIGCVSVPKFKKNIYFCEKDNGKSKNKPYITYKDIIAERTNPRQAMIQKHVTTMSDIITKLHIDYGLSFKELERIMELEIEKVKMEEIKNTKYKRK